MALVYDNTRSAKQGGGWIERPDANAFATIELPALRQQAADALAKTQGRWNTVAKVATAAAAVPFGVAAAPLLAGGSAAAGSGGIVGPMASQGLSWAAPAAKAGGMNIRALLQLGQLGAGLFGNLFGQRSQNRALDQATQEQARQFNAQQQMVLQAEATRKAEADRMAAQSEAQWNAQQRFQQDQFRASEEERLHARALADAAEARKAPRREMADQARIQLRDFIRLGRGY